MFLKIAERICQYANKKFDDIEILISAHVWLSMDHLCLPADFSQKLAAKFVGFFHFYAAIYPIIFHLELPP